MVQCKNIFGTFVVDYQENNSWLDLKRVDENMVELNKFLNVTFLSQEEDELIWKHDPSGMFSVISSYINSFDMHPEPYWAKAWVKGITPKINIFFQIILQNKIFTIYNLVKRGFNIINRCYLFKNDVE